MTHSFLRPLVRACCVFLFAAIPTASSFRTSPSWNLPVPIASCFTSPPRRSARTALSSQGDTTPDEARLERVPVPVPVPVLPTVTASTESHDPLVVGVELMDTDIHNHNHKRPDDRTELWLDLRGTALSPDAVVSHFLKELSSSNLDEDYGDNDDDDDDEFVLPTTTTRTTTTTTNRMPVDRILVSERDVSAFRADGGALVDRFPGNGPKIVWVNEEGVVLQGSDGGGSFPTDNLEIGRTVTDDPSPLPAWECVTSGQWALLDGLERTKTSTKKRGDPEETWRQRVDDLIEFLCMVKSTTTTTTTTVTPTTTDSSKSNTQTIHNLLSVSFDEGGGLAVPCRTERDVLRVCSTLERSRSHGAVSAGGGTSRSGSELELTESSILLFPSSSSDSGTSMENGATELSLGLALVLPYDVSLWRMAVGMLAVENEEPSMDPSLPLP